MHLAVYGMCYLVFGFVYGVVREWSSACLNGTRLGRPAVAWWTLRDTMALVNFPLIGMTCSLHERFPTYIRNIIGNEAFLLEVTGGGPLYWLAIAMVWPLCMGWSIVVLAVQITALFAWVIILCLCLLTKQIKEWTRSAPRD